MSIDLVRRDILRHAATGIAAAGLAAREASAQTLDPAEAERVLFPAPGLPSGGQMEVRMMVEDNVDPHIAELVRRIKPFNPESWHGEYKRIAELNEKMAEDFLKDGRKVTAGEFFLRSAGFYRSALVYLPVADKRTMPTYDKLKENFDKAWSILPPPFERVWIPYEGKKLMGFFFPARAPAGKKAPVVFNYGGADGILMSGAPDGGSGQYRARGISFLDVDGPGQGWALRKDGITAPADSERYGKAVADWLLTRDDVDHDRIAIHGSSMGGYTAPRVCTADHRWKACAVWSGAYALQQDIWDYYPPIRERLRWLIGAKDFDEGRKMMADFTLDGRADKIECPILVGYSIDDRVMDPRGALRLYNAATKGRQPEMVEGTGHGHRTWEKRTFIADWFAKQLGTA